MTGEDFANALPAGTRIGPVVLVRPIGQGAWGIVYEGLHDYWQRVAVKEFFPSAYAKRTTGNGVSSSAAQWQDAVRKGLARFTAEGQALRAIRYENVVPVLDFVEQDGSAYLVMEFIEGETLSSAIEGGRFRNPTDVMALGSALVRTLEAIHAKNILHRDIAPDNIMIRPDGTPVLIDFGGAAAAVASATRSTQNIVKDGYSPPEQYDASENAAFPVGPWSDIYATAAVLYRLVTGREPPVSNTRLMTAGARGQADPLTPLKTQSPNGYPGSWLAAIDAALALLPENRPQSAAAWQGMFQGSPPQQKRTRWPIVGGIAGAVALLGIAAFIIVRDQQRITTLQNVAVHVAGTSAPRAIPTRRPPERPQPKQAAHAAILRPVPIVTPRVVYVQATPRVVYVPAPVAPTVVSQSASDPILGLWRFDTGYTVEFLSNGDAVNRDSAGRQVHTGHWVRIGSLVRSTFQGTGADDYSTSGDGTSLTDTTLRETLRKVR